ncbi:MAG: SUMF1/EgtB/PvdO family nonheme iron enzyme [Treponema sp.]|nr:SUMF1/EgtB/PvdO family nonheme iron enzyme [Treponema sp.]
MRLVGMKAVALAAVLFCTGAQCFPQKKLSSKVKNAIENHFVEISDIGAEGDVFQIMDTEVPQWLWKEVMDSNPTEGGKNKGSKKPVIGVPFYDALVFCNRLSMMTGRTPCYTLNGTTDPDSWGTADSSWQSVSCNFAADGFRLPTIAEWRFAAEGGHIHSSYTYSGGNTIFIVAWCLNNSKGHVHDVATTRYSNPRGLYDMSGNASEWCWDPADVDGSLCRPILGGSYLNDGTDAEESRLFEVKAEPTLTADLIDHVAADVGVRLVCTLHTGVEADSAYDLVLEVGDVITLEKGSWTTTNADVVSVKRNKATAEWEGVATLSSNDGQRLKVKVKELPDDDEQEESE